MSVIIAPSILSADFSKLGQEVSAVADAGADWIHLDVMDGHFVPALTFGPAVISALRPYTDRFFDAHLMIANPDPYLAAYAAAGADCITVHAEVCPHLERTVTAIRTLGKQAGVALNPATDVGCLRYVLDKIDLVLAMTVNPGFGGQSYLPAVEHKLREIAAMIDGRPIRLEVDGGITDQTVPTAHAAGADTFVAGSFVFGGDYAERIAALKQACDRS